MIMKVWVKTKSKTYHSKDGTIKQCIPMADKKGNPTDYFIYLKDDEFKING